MISDLPFTLIQTGLEFIATTAENRSLITRILLMRKEPSRDDNMSQDDR